MTLSPHHCVCGFLTSFLLYLFAVSHMSGCKSSIHLTPTLLETVSSRIRHTVGGFPIQGTGSAVKRSGFETCVCHVLAI